MNLTDKDYGALRLKLVDAAGRMQADGWWLGSEQGTGEKLRRAAPPGRPSRAERLRSRIIG